MKAMLLAAGRGTRLAPLTDTTPKILAPFGARPLLVHQLEYLQHGGVSEVALNVHHHADQVLACLRELSLDVPVRVSHERELLGTAGALVPLRDFFTEPAIVLYGDVLTDADLAELMDEHRRHEPLATLAVYPSRESVGKGVVRLDETGRVAAFVEKPAAESGEVLINAGLYVLSPRLLELLQPGASDFGHDVWPRVLAGGGTLRASVLDAYVRDIGSPAQLAAAAEDLAAGALAW
ncbi:MAG TPA: nucleotidyltransferase family protein [Solirubrobacteraceae bacterium]|jgi:NDP-sugar pyrophosphorylase family protein